MDAGRGHIVIVPLCGGGVQGSRKALSVEEVVHRGREWWRLARCCAVKAVFNQARSNEGAISYSVQ